MQYHALMYDPSWSQNHAQHMYDSIVSVVELRVWSATHTEPSLTCNRHRSVGWAHHVNFSSLTYKMWMWIRVHTRQIGSKALWYIRNIYSFFVTGSWHRTSKTLGIYWVICVREASFFPHNKSLSTIPEFLLMRWLKVGPLDSFEMGTGCQKKQPYDEKVRTFNLTLTSEEERGAGGWVQSPMD